MFYNKLLVVFPLTNTQWEKGEKIEENTSSRPPYGIAKSVDLNCTSTGL